MIKIVSQTEADVSAALNLNTMDVFVCENCGKEMPIIPGTKSQFICISCGKTMDKSLFSPLTRTQKLWVSEKGRKRLEQLKNYSFNCVGYYRDVIHFRHAIVENYYKRGKITLPQATAMLAAFCAGTSQGVITLLDRNKKLVSDKLRKLGESDGDSSGASLVWDWLGTMQIQKKVGRPPRTDSLVLLLDAAVLMFCPNNYLHFLRDALRLRIHEYRVESDHPTAHRETWHRFWKATKAVEIECKRSWQAWFKEGPESPPKNWWERVAREQGLIGSGTD